MSPSPPAGQHTVRRHNCALVLGAIAEEPGVSRAGIAARTSLAKATVSSVIDRLAAADLVTETGTQPRSGRGRKGTGLSLAPAGPHGVGVEIGVDYLATCLVDLAGRMRARRVRPGDNSAQSARRVLARLATAVRTTLRDAESMGVAVGGLGIAVPGLVEGSEILRSAPNLGWHDLNLRAELTARVDLGDMPVLAGNEADFAAFAELMGGQLTDFVHVSGEVGIGAGIVLDRAVFRGIRGFAGEIGHLCVDPSGPLCRCGSRGCLERLAGQEQILARAGIAGSEEPGTDPDRSVDELRQRLHAGDTVAVDAVHEAARWLAIGLAAVVNTVDVPTVVLGGSYARLEPWLRGPLLEELTRRVVSGAWSPVTVLPSRLGREAAVRGAAASAVRAIITDPDPYVTAHEHRSSVDTSAPGR